MKTETIFKNEFKNFTVPAEIDIRAINGYSKALQHLYAYLAKVTAFNPANRYIDAVPLLDSIGEVNAELMELLKEAEKGLKAEMFKF